MKNNAKFTPQFRLQVNTDNRDIDAESIGVDAWVIGDSTNQLNSNRGLHIQIRHNQDDATFDAATQLAALIAAAPDLLDAVATIYTLCDLQPLLETKYSKPLVDDIMRMLRQTLAKARRLNNETKS